MRPSNLTIPRTHPARRLLRPPNLDRSHPPAPRPFSHRSPRLLLVNSYASPRPQLPFLYPTSNGQVFRFFTISTGNKKFIKETAVLTVKFTAIFWVISTCFTIASLGFMSERQERAFPSPPEWSLWTRFRFRRGKWWEIPENNEDIGFPNWARLYAEYDHARKRLESPRKDGEGIVEQDEVEGIGELGALGEGAAGFNLTAKSEQWRQGYYEVLMGMGRAAERLEGWVTDKWRWNVWAPEFIPSPTNPRPKVPPPGMPLPPEDPEKQLKITETPEYFYLKILTSRGFNTYQRMTAALSYADWLAFKQLPSSAEEMYRWGLDIAISGLPSSDPPPSIIDRRTAILSSTAPPSSITPNLVHAATTLATHLASTGDLTTALPIYISCLRARLHAPIAPPTPATPPPDASITGTLVSLLSGPPTYPPLPPTGDETLLRRQEDLCTEASLKSYIGEILFATAGSNGSSSIAPKIRHQGLTWVRDAVSTATLAQTLDIIAADPAKKKQCQMCEEVGLEAWGKMMMYLAAEAREQRDAVKGSSVKALVGRVGWGPGREEVEKRVEDLEGEEEGVAMRLAKLRHRIRQEEFADMDRKYARTFVF
ncbi:hypothetical protein BCR34DRAFT_568809 [Clohesyomyces aquaticus]|uniref:MFS maltose permease n=1 Tax=Clohesyomyces aquaticus TaxID=1231657 RepID=A0A1Y1ZHF9_9PLEO|nr:hypothetical protein BCR34DRAFT_568809 [Clohesyomyces aquaticus]